MPAVTRSSSDGILSRISNNSTQLDEKWDCNERKQWVIKNFESIVDAKMKSFRSMIKDHVKGIKENVEILINSIPRKYRNMKVNEYIALCEQAHKRKTSGTADFLYEIDEIVSSIVNGVPRKSLEKQNHKTKGNSETVIKRRPLTRAQLHKWKSDTNMTEAHNCNTYDSGYGHSVSTTNLSTKLLKKQNCYKKARKQTPIISNGPIVGGASSSSSTADFERPFGCFSNSKFQESLAKNTLRKPRPGERFYLMSESGSPLSNLDHARSMPALYLPLEDGKTVALTTDISFSSLDMRFKRDMEKFKTKFNSVLGNISQVNVDNGLK